MPLHPVLGIGQHKAQWEADLCFCRARSADTVIAQAALNQVCRGKRGRVYCRVLCIAHDLLPAYVTSLFP